MEPAPLPATIGPFNVGELLSEGDFSRTFRAQEPATGRHVVLKVGRQADLLFAAQLRQEFVLATRLRHPHIRRALDHGMTATGEPYLVLEHHPGGSLAASPGPHEPAQVVRWGLKLARALAALHAEGLVHRDLTPAHVLVDPSGQVRLGDLGRVAPAPSPPSDARVSPYVAPESLRGEAVDGRADLFSLGCVLAELLTGQAPFHGVEAAALREAVCHHPPHPLPSSVPVELARLVGRLLAKDPGERPATAEVVVALSAMEESGPRWLPEATFLPPAGWADWCERLAEPGCWAWVGEPGSGRTRCIEEAFLVLRRLGRPAVMLGGEPGAGPYTLLEQLWRWAAARAPGAVAAVPRPLARLMASLWPWAFPEALPLDEPGRLARVLPELLRQLLQAAGGGSRVTLLVDDWDQADAVSRDLLLGALSGPLRDLSLVLAGRTAVPEVRTVSLAPFDSARVQAWLTSILGREPAPAWVGQLVRVAGGNPGWMMEALPHMLAGPEEALAMPESVETLLASAWQGLSANQRTAMVILALHGGGCSPQEWRLGVAQLPDDWPLDWQTLEARRLVVAGGGRLRLALGWWVEWILTHESATRLARLSAELARALATAPAAAATPLSPTVAHRIARLAQHGDDPALAVRWSTLAAEAAARVWAYESVGAHAAMGLAAADALGLATRGTVVLALRGLEADAQRVLGRLSEAIASYETLVGQSQDASARGRWLTSLGKCRLMLGQNAEAMAAYDAAIATLSGAGDLRECARARAALGRVRFLQGDRQASLEAYRQSLVEARQCGARTFEAEALSLLGMMAVETPATLAEGLEALQTSLRILEEDGNPYGRLDSQNLLGNALLTLGQARAARPHFAACREQAVEIAYPHDEALACFNLALCDIEHGHWRRAASWLEAAERLALDTQYQFLAGFVAHAEALVRIHTGELARAQAVLVTAREREAQLDSSYLRQFGLVQEAARHLWLGAFQPARQAAEAALEALAAAGGGDVEFRAWALLAEACLFSGERARAEEALGRLQDLAAGRGAALRAAVARLEGLAASVQGDPEGARRGWREALGIAREEENAGLEVELVVALHQLARETGPDAGAAAELERAQSLAERLGDPALLGITCLAGALTLRGNGEEQRADRLMRRGHELLSVVMAELPEGNERTLFLGHPLRAPWCQVRALEDAYLLAQRTRRLEMLLTLGRSLGAAREPDAVLGQVTALTLELTRAERCLVLLMEPGGTAWRPWKQAPTEAYCHTVVAEVVATRSPVCVVDTLSDASWAGTRSIQELGLRSVMCVPLNVGDTLYGLLYVDSRVALGTFGPDDVRVLEAIAAQAAVALDTTRLLEALRAQMQQQAAHIRLLAEKDTTITALRDYDRARQAAFEAESHDLKAPLAAILVASQGLLKGLDGPLNEAQSETVSGLLANTRALMIRIDGILDAAGLEVGRLTLRLGAVSMQRIVTECLSILRPVAEAKRIGLTDPAPDWEEVPLVRGDARRLAQVVQNLLDNALKYTTEGAVSVKLARTSEGVRLTVVDTGPGLPPERRDAPFQRYGIRDAAQHGSGLGLWRVAALVDQHGGTITLTCPEGGGTRVEVTLPEA